MPLSEHEQHMLQQMEQALYDEDPKFASHMQGAGAKAAARRRLIIGGLGVLAGLALVLVGVSTTMWLGAVGFALMVAAVAYALTPPRRGQAALGSVQGDGSIRPAAGRPKKTSKANASFMQRLEERWDRRRDDI